MLKKRMLSLLISLTMLLMFMPAMAFANDEENNENQNDAVSTEQEVEVVTETHEEAHEADLATETETDDDETESGDTHTHVHVAGSVENVVITEATCTKKGSYYEVTLCKECGKEISRVKKTSKALGHSIHRIAAKAATCQETGIKAHYECQNCGGLYKDAKGKKKTTLKALTIKKKKHSFKKKIISEEYLKSAANCTKPAVYYYTCKMCGEKGKKTFKSGKALGHSFDTVVTKATTNKNGSIAKKCTRCGKKAKATKIYKASKVTIDKKYQSVVFKGNNAETTTVSVKNSKKKAISKDFYDLSFDNNYETGIGTVTVTFKGNYEGTKTLNYKITKIPFSEVKKPTIEKIVDYTKTLGYHFMCWNWDGYEDVDKNEIYVSRNGGEYTFFASTNEYYYNIKNLEPGKYKFKVRGVIGNYYSDFSNEYSYTVEEEFNASFAQDLPLTLADENTQITINDADVNCSVYTGGMRDQLEIRVVLEGTYSGVPYWVFKDKNINYYIYVYDDEGNLCDSKKMHIASSGNDSFWTMNSFYFNLSKMGHHSVVLGVE